MNDINKILELPIDKLDLSVRSYFCLKNSHIQTIGDLINCNKMDLYSVRNLGIRCYDEIILKVHEIGLYFKDEREEIKEKRIKK